MRRPSLSLTLVAAAVLGVASCSVSSTDPPAAGGKQKVFAALPGDGLPPLDPQIVAQADPRRVTMPLSAYQLDDAKARIVNRARTIVGDSCMADFGFTPMPWKAEGAVALNIWGRWGIWDAERAAVHGYMPIEVTEGNPYPVRYEGAGETEVYFGQVAEYRGRKVPDGGCGAQEAKAIFGGAGRDPDGNLATDLDDEARARAAQDPRVTAKLTAWRTCIEESGWNFADPIAPMDHWVTRRGPDQANQVVSAEERASALADIGCKKSTGLLGTWLAADIAYQQALIDRDAGKLRIYQNKLDETMARSNDIIARG